MTIEVHDTDSYDIRCPYCGCGDWSAIDSWLPFLSSDIRYEKYRCLNYFECGKNYWVERWLVKSTDDDSVEMLINYVDTIQEQKERYGSLPSPKQLAGYWLR